MIRRLVTLASIVALVGGGLLLPILTAEGQVLLPEHSFVDVEGNVHEGFIEAIAAEGVTRGCNPPANDRYCPSDPITRGQMAAFLNRALPLASTNEDFFVDDDGSIFEADINALAASGITRGCNPPTNDRFCPDDPVSRGEMAAFLVRGFGYTDVGESDLFTDDDDSVFEGDIDRLGTAEVTRGCNPPTNDRFCPHDPVRRDQMASFLGRALRLQPGTGPGEPTVIRETILTPSSPLTTQLNSPRKQIWWHDDHWWILANGYFVYRRDGANDWQQASGPIVGENSRRNDVSVDRATGTIYIYGYRSTPDDHLVGTATYDPITRTYGNPIFYGNRRGDPALPNWGDTRGGISHAIDSRGRMWVVGDDPGMTRFMVLDPKQFHGGSPILRGLTVLDDDIWTEEHHSRVVAFTDATGPSIGVLLDDQVSDEMRFWVRRDSDPLGSPWTLEIIDTSPKTADDHSDVVATPAGEVLAVWKTRESGPTDRNLMYARRTRAGDWVDLTVASTRFGTASTQEYAQSRIQYDVGLDRVYVIARSRATGYAHVLESPRLSPGFTPGPILNRPIRNVQVAARPLTDGSGLLVIAEDSTTLYGLFIR